MKKKPEYIEYEDGTRVELGEDDAPELTEEFFKNARSFKEQFPELHASWKRKMGRPPKDNPKRSVKLRIDPEVLDSFKALGKGWHTSINNALKDWAKQHGML